MAKKSALQSQSKPSRCRILVQTSGTDKVKTFPFTPNGYRKATNIAKGVMRNKRNYAMTTIAVRCYETSYGKASDNWNSIPIALCTKSGCELADHAGTPGMRRRDAKNMRGSKMSNSPLAGAKRRRK